MVSFAFSYHITIPYSKATENVPTAKKITEGAYYTYGQAEKWNETFLHTGWNTQKEVNTYLYLRNYLYPDSNLLFNKKVFDINTGGFRLKRNDYINEYITGFISQKKAPYEFKRSEIILLKSLGITYLILPYKTTDSKLTLLDIVSQNKNSIYVFRVNESDSHFYYIPQKIYFMEYVSDFEDLITKGKISDKQVAIEEKISQSKDNSQKVQILFSKKMNNTYRIDGIFKENTFVVLRQSYYPEWQAKIDGKTIPIIKTNLIQMGVSIPPGKHTLTFSYQNNGVKIGLVITTLYLAIFGIILRYLKFI
jgi:hypothetical protein